MVHDVRVFEGEETPEQVWERLTEHARAILEKLGTKRENGDGLVYAVPSPGPQTRAALAELHLLGLVFTTRIPGESAMGYGTTPVGDAILLLGKPESPADAQESYRVQKFLNRPRLRER